MNFNQTAQDKYCKEVISTANCSKHILWYIDNLDDEHKYSVIINARMELVRVETVKRINRNYLNRILKDQGQTARVWIAALMRLSDRNDVLLLKGVLEDTEHSEIIEACASRIRSSMILYKLICTPSIDLSNKKALVKAIKEDKFLMDVVRNNLFDMSLRKLALGQIKSDENKMSAAICSEDEEILTHLFCISPVTEEFIEQVRKVSFSLYRKVRSGAIRLVKN